MPARTFCWIRLPLETKRFNSYTVELSHLVKEKNSEERERITNTNHVYASTTQYTSNKEPGPAARIHSPRAESQRVEQLFPPLFYRREGNGILLSSGCRERVLGKPFMHRLLYLRNLSSQPHHPLSSLITLPSLPFYCNNHSTFSFFSLSLSLSLLRRNAWQDRVCRCCLVVV